MLCSGTCCGWRQGTSKITTRPMQQVTIPSSGSMLSPLSSFSFSERCVSIMEYMVADPFLFYTSKLFQCQGLRTFNTPRYRQFAKRLGRLIRHTVSFLYLDEKVKLFFQVHYVSDHWEAFKLAQGDTLDPSMLLRLQVEYDNFFLRAARYGHIFFCIITSCLPILCCSFFLLKTFLPSGASFPPKNLVHGSTWRTSLLQQYPRACFGGSSTRFISTITRRAVGTLGVRYTNTKWLSHTR